MIRFPDEPDLSPVSSNCSLWRLRAPFLCALPGGVIEVPAEFTTDGATVPRAFWIAYPPTGALLLAAIVHDFAYAQLAAGTPHPLAPTRAAADAIFREAAIAVGVPVPDAWTIWAAVRLFGGRHARPDRLAAKAAAVIGCP